MLYNQIEKGQSLGKLTGSKASIYFVNKIILWYMKPHNFEIYLFEGQAPF